MRFLSGNSLHCLQLDPNLWQVYLSDSATRQKLLTEGIHIQNVSVAFFNTNSFSSGSHSTSDKKNPLKIRLFGLSLSVDDSAGDELLEKMDVKPKSKVLYEKIIIP